MPAKSPRQASRRRQSVQTPSWRVRIRQFALTLTVVLGLGLVMGATAWAGNYLMELPVERLVLRGEFEHVTQSEVEQLLRQELSGGFLQADLGAARERLETLPWIYRAVVKRRWPDAIEIQVTEQQPIARWGLDGFLNHQGEYFPGAFSERWQTLARLEGPAGSEAAMTRRYRNLEAMLEPVDLQVSSLTEDALGQVTAELDTGLVLRLGSEDHARRIQRFLVLMQEHLPGSSVASIDMRYEHGAAVSFHPIGQQPLGSFAQTHLEDRQ